MPTRLRRRAPLLAATLLLLAACERGRGPTELPEPEEWIGAEARVYVDSALNLMQSYSLHKHGVDWPSFRAALLRRVNGAHRPAQTHTAIHEALQSLDRHSFLVRPTSALQDELAQVGTVFGGKLLQGRFGYVRTASVSGPALGHAQQYHDMIRDMDGDATCGWVVDLRFNTGGNMWPMLAGVGPILGEGSPGRFVDADGAVKVGDFGLSISTLTRDVRHELATAGFEGTPQFAAPEQLRGEPLDVRSDIYAVGAVGYFLLTGKRVFEGKTTLDICIQHVTKPVTPPSQVTSEPILPDLEAIIMKCLAKAPADRYASARELRDALRALPHGATWDDAAARAWWRTFRATQQEILTATAAQTRTITINVDARPGVRIA